MPSPDRHPHPSVAVDIAALAVKDGALACLLMRRDDAKTVGGDWALPGAFVREGRPFEEALSRVLSGKLGLPRLHTEQLATYGDPARDPRGHVVSVTYLAPAPATELAAIARRDGFCLARISVAWEGEAGGPATAHAPDGTPLKLAFDHAAILGDVVKRLRGKLDYTPIGFAFLPARFTLRDAQEVHEAVLGRPLNKPAFRRKLLDRHRLRPTGTRESGGAFRPAELYEVQAVMEE